MTQRKPNGQFSCAAKRRATDRALLAACERAIALEGKSAVSVPKTETPPSAAASDDSRAEPNLPRHLAVLTY